MAVLRRRLRPRVVSAFALLFIFFFFFFFFSSAVSLTPSDDGFEKKREEVTGSENPDRISGQMRSNGPGSSPPTCKSKCGSCEPCKPVHVPVQPGVTTPLEYYPEAWQCKCGNKLYMP